MPGLVTLPIRLWARGARVALHAAEDVTELALTGTLRVAGALVNLRERGAHATPAPSMATPAVATPAGPPPARPRPPARTPRARTRAAATAPEPSAAPEQLASERLEAEGVVVEVDLETPDRTPAHISEEPVVAREEADPGAEDGAGASVTVREPWEGYHALGARAVVDRVGAGSAEELAAIELYEISHRNRRTVIEAVARELKSRPRRG